MQSTANRDLVVGVFVLLGLLAIAHLSLRIGGLTLQQAGGFELLATFDDIGGLTERSPVKISGVRVGQVRSITLDDDLRAQVVLDLAPGLELSVDTFAVIRTSGLLGDQFVALEPGADDLLLQSGESFSFTESAVNLDKLISSVVHGDGVSGGGE